MGPDLTPHTPSEATAGSQGRRDFTCESVHCHRIRLRSIEADTILYNSGISACVKGHLVLWKCLEMQRHCQPFHPSAIQPVGFNREIGCSKSGGRLEAPAIHVLNLSVPECWGSKVETWPCQCHAPTIPDRFRMAGCIATVAGHARQEHSCQRHLVTW